MMVATHWKQKERSLELHDRYSKYDLTGQRINRLTVLQRQGSNKQGKALYLVKCDCGTTKTMRGGDLKSGRVFSCGCYAKEVNRQRAGRPIYKSYEHKRLYYVFEAMKQRCSNPNKDDYQYYGAKGVRVCDEWKGQNGWDNFSKWAFENGFDEKLSTNECSLDRINPFGNYEPLNCRWVDMKTQASNKRANSM